jgi:two-component system, sensor histidine kinase
MSTTREHQGSGATFTERRAPRDNPTSVQHPPHPRTLGWIGTTALAIGGSNQSLFLIGALFIGQGDILGQGSAAVPLLALGLLLSWAAAPGWTELVLMWPNRVGGIAATCGEAFKPYAPVLANLAGTCYWWGWVPTCGLTALLSASAIHSWYLPDVPITPLAIALLLCFAAVNLCGVKWVARMILPIGVGSAVLALLSGLLPIYAGQVDWHQAVDFHLTTPFDGAFGKWTSLMAGLYLIGFAAPAFEAAACHVGETVDPARNVPRAMLASALMAAVFFVVLPVVWLGALGSDPLGMDLALVLGPTFAPLFGAGAKAAAVWFMMLNMFHGTVQPLAGASRTLSQLAEDGLLPQVLARRSSTDTPWVATLLTSAMAIFFLLIGDPIWLVAAANFTYLIGITLPSVAVWLLRRDAPDMPRPYRAPKGTILLGLAAAVIWGISAIMGFQQFGLPTVLFGLVFAYSGAALYALRLYQDRRKAGLPGLSGSLHIKLTGAMLAVLVLDGAGYLLAVGNVPAKNTALISALEDIFVAVAMLTISVGLILPGMIAHSAVEVAHAAERLAKGTVADFSRAMRALGDGRLADAHARIDRRPVAVSSRDELGAMAVSFNALQDEIAGAASGLHDAREGLRTAQSRLEETNRLLEWRVEELRIALAEREAAQRAADAANRAKSQFLANMSHEIRTPINGVLGMTDMLLKSGLAPHQQRYADVVQKSGQSLLGLINDILDFSKIEAGRLDIESVDFDLRAIVNDVVDAARFAGAEKGLAFELYLDENLPQRVTGDPLRLRQVLTNLVSNAIKFTDRGHVAVSATLKSAPTEGRIVVGFDVEDTGIGMNEETLAKLFKPFTQADMSTTRQYGGTGLGLVISRQLADLMGGSISISSVVGAGSRAQFLLPLASASASGASEHAASPVLPRLGRDDRILLAEDNLVNREIALSFLETLGYPPESVDTAANGREAVEKVKAGGYGLVLMDCLMPDMDGYEATAEIRALESVGALCRGATRLPIIALTANAMAGDRERCIAVGMSDYLSKPYSADELRRVLDRWVHATPGSTAPQPGAADSWQADARTVDLTFLRSIPALQAGGTAIVDKVVGVFRADGNRLMQAIERAQLPGDEVVLREAAAALRSCGAGLGAHALARCCGELEQQVREGRSVTETIQALRQQFEAVLAALAEAELTDALLDDRQARATARR